MSVHVFQSSGMRDVYQRSICAVCDNVRQARVHDVPEVDDEAKALTERILGETEPGIVATQGE